MEQLSIIREQLEIKLKMFCYCLFITNENVVSTCEDLVGEIENLFAKYSDEEEKQLLSGEFQFGNYHTKDNKVPFYLYMEILYKVLNKKYGNLNNDEKLNNLLNRLKILKDETEIFSYNNKFDSDKELTDELIDNLILSKGSINFSLSGDYGTSFPIVSSLVTYEDIKKRSDGEYYSSGSPVLVKKECFLYEEDRRWFEDLENRKNEELRGKYKNVVSKYFKGGKMPEDFSEFDACLIDDEIMPNIIIILREIIFSRSKFSKDRHGELEWMKFNARFLEGILELEQMKKEEFKKVSSVKPFVEDKKDLSMIDNSEVVVTTRTRKEAFKEMLKLMKECLGFKITDNYSSKKRK